MWVGGGAVRSGDPLALRSFPTRRPSDLTAAQRAALAELNPIAVSRIHSTPALGPAGRGFANAVAIVKSKLEPDELLAELKALERAYGRRPGRRWGPRVLDLDIILWSEGPWDGPGALVPHVEFRNRAYVLKPLAELAPDWRDPVTGLTVRQLLFRLTGAAPAHR